MAKVNPIAILAEQLLRALSSRGSEAYPTTRSALAASAVPEASTADLAKAFRKQPCAASFLFARKSHPDSPLVLSEDAEHLAASPRLLDFALGLICTAQKPAHPLAAVVKKIDKGLQSAFAAALERRLGAKDWPETVGVATIKNKPHLYLQRLPPPPPPPATQLALALLDALHQLRQAGLYPVTLTHLVQRVAAGAAPELVRQALAEKSFKPQVLVALANHLDSPVALTPDAAALAVSPLLLETVLAATRQVSNQAIPAANLTKKLNKVLRQPFAEQLAQRLEISGLPAGIGCLRIKAKPHLFLWKDVSGSGAAPPSPVSSETPHDFAQRFEEAFTRLDQETGASNFVSLVALRRLLPVERQVFDEGLDALRRADRYTLSGAEGRHGVSDVERDAGIREDGALLLYVSRKREHVG